MQRGVDAISGRATWFSRSMSTSFLFEAGRIQALQSQLIQSSQIERMIGAETAEDAFRILADSPYASAINTKSDAHSFQVLLNEGLLQGKALITGAAGTSSVLDVLWARYDLANLKWALRGGRGGHFSALGTLEKADVLRLVSLEDDELPEHLASSYWADVLTDLALCDTVLEKEVILDTFYFSVLLRIAKENPKEKKFLRGMRTLLLDQANLKALLRLLFTFKREARTTDFFSGGTFSVAQLQQVSSLDELRHLVRGTSYEFLFTDLSDTMETEVVLGKVEQRATRMYIDFLLSAESDTLDGPQIPIAYFERRVHNARLITFIMLGKLANLPVNILRDRTTYLMIDA